MTHSSRCLFTALALALLPACVAPQLVSPAGVKTLDAWANWPVERVEVEVEGATLRGVCSYGEEGAPIVLALLGEQISITAPEVPTALCFDGSELVFGSWTVGARTLALDYRGVGASDGECDSRHLAADAWAMWLEALRRAEGDPSRVIVRATSIGTLAAASLLERGARPACVVLHAPVRAESFARNRLERDRSPLVAALLAPFLRQPVDVDILSAIRNASMRVIAFTSPEDELTTREDRELLLAAVRASRGRWIEREVSRDELVGSASSIGESELREYARLFPGKAPSWLYPPSCVLPDFRDIRLETIDLTPTDLQLREGSTFGCCAMRSDDLERRRAVARDE